MAFRDLAVHLDDSGACDRRIDVAFTLAKAHEAAVTGIYVDPGVSLPAYPEMPSAATEQLIAELREEQDVRASSLRQAFEERARATGVRCDWRTTRHDPGVAFEYHAALAQYCRYCDLTVVGQSNPDDIRARTGIADALVLALGRPVLVVPYVASASTVGQRVLVAWNNSRESARALADAIPVLRRAERVDVLVVNADPEESPEGDLPGADIARHLARHDVRAEVHRAVAGDIEVGDLILSRAADFGADLIVMGAYGHSRLREWALGGATRQLLHDMTVPVFMSH